MDTIKNKYYFTALDNYPYNLQECMEALGYALSYDSEDVDSLCLLGRVYSEILRNYEKAKTYFEEAMLSDINNVNTPQYYIHCLLNNDDLEEAQKLIDYSLKIKGIDKSNITYYQSILYEKKGDYGKALKQIAEAKKWSVNQNMTNFLDEREKFVKAKCRKNKVKRRRKPNKVSFFMERC